MYIVNFLVFILYDIKCQTFQDCLLIHSFISLLETGESADESELEDGDQHLRLEIPFPSHYVTRDPNPVLPETVTALETPYGSKVYVVGTAHFSEQSQEDVAQVHRLVWLFVCLFVHVFVIS